MCTTKYFILTSCSPSSSFTSGSTSSSLLYPSLSIKLSAGKLPHLFVSVILRSSTSSFCICFEATLRITSTLKMRSSNAACCSKGGFKLALTQGPKQGVDHALGSPPENNYKFELVLALGPK